MIFVFDLHLSHFYRISAAHLADLAHKRGSKTSIIIVIISIIIYRISSDNMVEPNTVLMTDLAG